jgi:hypothetical protein
MGHFGFMEKELTTMWPVLGRGAAGYALCAVVLLALSFAGVAVADTKYTIQATVLDIDGAPLPEIALTAGELKDGKLKTPAQVVTDAEGKATLSVTTESNSAKVGIAVVDEPRGRVHEPVENLIRVKPGNSAVLFRLLPLPDAESAVGGGEVTTAGYFSGSGSGDQYPALETISVAMESSLMQRWPARTQLGRPPVVLVQGLPLTSTQVAPMEVYNQFFSLVEALRRDGGRDVWIVALQDAKDPVAGNALAVSGAVAQAAELAGSGAKVDVIGVSLGGVIVRYALASDEAKDGPSKGRVRVFASIDAPHQGANITLGLQAGLWLVGGKSGQEILSSFAVQNFLYRWVGGDNWAKKDCGFPENRRIHATAAAHDWFYGQLNTLNGDGYPRLSRNVALANGNLAARGRQEGDVVYSARVYADLLLREVDLCKEDFKAGPWDVLPGSLLPANLLPKEADLGSGLHFELDTKFEPTFIPTASALDIRDGRSKFDATFVPTGAAHHHGEVPPKALDFLLREILL